MSDNIPPFEIQLEIIKKVSDAKSLLRFRSVSKPWRSFIDSSDFIAGYGDTRPQSSLLFLRYQDNKTFEKKYICCVDVDENETLTQQHQHDFSPNVTDFMKQFTTLNVVGSSHGLLCFNALDRCGDIFILWNPFIRRSFGIQLTYSPGIHSFAGFLVCPVTNDPTIVMITYPWKVGVFKLNSKRFTVFRYTKLPCKSIQPISSQVVVIDNSIYWAARDVHWSLNGSRYVIVSFDLIAKDIRLVDIPQSCLLNNPVPERIFISKLRESLVLFVPNYEVEILVCGVWKMEHDESFTNLFTISTPDYTIRNVLGFRKNGELVLETEKEEDKEFAALKVYDPRSECSIDLGIHGLHGTFFLDSYKETLLLLNHSDGYVYPDRN